MYIHNIQIERIIIYGKNNERDKAHEFIRDNRYSTLSNGPRPLRKLRYDMTQFKIVAERIDEKTRTKKL